VNRSVSYYEKGLWAGMALDLTLRLASGGARGLPELFRLLWDDFGRRERPISEADVRAAAAALAGRRLDDFFARYIHGTDELPLPRLWRRAGLTLRERPEWDERDRPPADRDPVRSGRARAWSGIALYPDRSLVRTVVPGSPAWQAGLTFNDEIVAVDGCRVGPATFGKRIGDSRPGRRARIAYFRRDLLEEATLTLAESPERRLSIAPDPRASHAARAVRDGWLGAGGAISRGSPRPPSRPGSSGRPRRGRGRG